MLDKMQILLWSATYVLIIIGCALSSDTKKVAMPYAAGVMNFAWEACALQLTKSFWGHYLWLGLDLFIVGFGYLYLRLPKQKGLYLTSILVLILGLSWVFEQEQGMLISVFIIDLIMAVAFLVDRSKLTPKMKIPIAVSKLLGDACAGLFYSRDSIVVCILAILVAICNTGYLILCVRENAREIQKN